MVLIFCASYLSIPSTIDAISNENDDFRIFSANFEVTKFFSELYPSDNVIKLPELFSSFKDPRLFFSDLINLARLKKKYLRIIKNLEPDKIVFFFVGLNSIASWLIKKMSPNVEIYYRPAVKTSFDQNIFDIRLNLKKIFLEYLFDTSLKVGKFGDHVTIRTDERFIKMVRAKTYPEIKGTRALVSVISHLYPDLQEYKVLLLLGRNRFIDEQEYNNKLISIINVILEYFQPDQIAIKQHPNPNLSVSDKIIPKGFITIPDHIPANLLFYKCSVLISWASGTLFEAANAGKTSISLLHIIDSTSPRIAEFQKKYLLINSKKQICFPDNLEILGKMLQPYSKNMQ